MIKAPRIASHLRRLIEGVRLLLNGDGTTFNKMNIKLISRHHPHSQQRFPSGCNYINFLRFSIPEDCCRVNFEKNITVVGKMGKPTTEAMKVRSVG
jgi:hypothetical protein